MISPRWRDLPADLVALHGAALAAADPAAAVARALSADSRGLQVFDERLALPPSARLFLLAAGKAALGMAGAALAICGERIRSGVVAHPRRGAESLSPEPSWPAGLRRFAAGHPLPDEASLAAGAATLEMLANVRGDDVVLVLLSGGASALLESPLSGLSLAELRAVTRALQRAGADVEELNSVRGCLSRLKHGGLARAAAPARVVTLAISDVVGDRPSSIGSGPTVSSSHGPGVARELLDRTGVAALFPGVVARLDAAAAEPARQAAPGLFRIVLANRDAAGAVARCAADRGFRAQVVTTFLQGEAREAGRMIGGCAASVSAHGAPFAAPACLIFGGETTVTVRGSGQGGRNQEVALGAALAIADRPKTAVLAFATDGVDGASDAAGALATGETLARADALGLSPHRALADNDSAPFFRALGDSWHSGPSGTNVNDLVVALVYP